MRNDIIFILLVAVIGNTGFAQGKRIRPQRSNGMIWLFDPGNKTMYHDIQIELDTNTSQMRLITKLVYDLDEQTVNTREAAKGNGPEAPAKVSAAEARRLNLKIDRSGEELLRAILSARQFTRAKEITRQRQGYRVFENSDFVAQLKLDKSQRATIAKILRKDRLSEEDEDAISDVLNSKQQTLWLKLKGAPFKIASRRPGPGRGRSGSRRPLPEDR